jgi:hydroxyethylthiazole kinase-like uncharacterized protein yjeF
MRPLLERLVHAARARGLAVVLDADALNHLAQHAGILPDGDHAAHVVLTPHPGEAARLLATGIPEVQADRIAAASALARRYRAVAALKGARTVIAAPDGRIAISPTGNEGMGTGGTGDVLTGCVGALLARGFDAFDAACAGVYLHGAAGDLVAATEGVIGLTAGDLALALPRALQQRTA